MFIVNVITTDCVVVELMGSNIFYYFPLQANLLLPRGIGEKLLLRIAAFKLDLFKTAGQPKRAIQFGSKIAKLDNSKEKGSEICTRLS